MTLTDAVIRFARRLTWSPVILRRRFPDFDSQTFSIIKKVMPCTMTSPERIAALVEAVRHVEANNVPGAFAECGVYRGGSSMAAALTFATPRDLYLFDTFEGMPPPTDDDRRARDNAKAESLLVGDRTASKIWCYSTLDEVKRNMTKTGYPEHKIHFIKGRIENTVPKMAPAQLAILRLDTDWYASTRHELEHLFPVLSPGGILIIDDYGFWTGARKAVDEYFAGSGLFLHRIDADARMLQKPTQ